MRLPGPPLVGRGIFDGMDPELVVAEHFAQLVNLAVHQRPDEELQESLSALLEALESLPDSGVDLSTDGQLLRANHVEVPNSIVGVNDLVSQCGAFGLSSLYLERKTSADELLLVARALGAEPVPGQAEQAFRGSLIGVDRIIPTFALIPRVLPRPTRSLTPEDWGRTVPSENRAHSVTFAAVRRYTGSLNELFVRLMAGPTREALPELQEQLFQRLGEAVRDGQGSTVLEVFEFIADRLDKAGDDRVQQMWQTLERRCIRPLTLEPLCQQLLVGGEEGRRAIDVARRIGAPAVEQLLEMLTATDSRHERATLFNGLLTMRIEAGFLRHLMHDQRWYVARNAVDLAGKGARRELEDDLIEMTEHVDERVKLAALHGLARLGTPKALVVLHNAMKDPSPAIRTKAAAALGSLRRTLAMPMVSAALAHERDTTVITALKVALGIHSRPSGPQALVDERRSVLRMTLGR